MIRSILAFLLLAGAMLWMMPPDRVSISGDDVPQIRRAATEPPIAPLSVDNSGVLTSCTVVPAMLTATTSSGAVCTSAAEDLAGAT